MKIDRFELTGNKLLMLVGINSFKATFDNDCQILIGTNGAGKSTIFRELSFLPPDTAHYTIGGSKLVEGEHNGIRYRAESKKMSESSWVHSLLKLSNDGQDTELNPGHTKTVQAQVVEQVFGISQDIFDILVGDTKFTQMTPAKRREWMLFFSGSDLEYANSVYKRLVAKQKDAAAVLEHCNKRLANELDQQLSDEEIINLSRESEKLVRYVNETMIKISSQRVSVDHVQNDIQRQFGKLSNCLEEILTDRFVFWTKPAPLKHLESVDDFMEFIHDKEKRLISNQAKLQTYHEQSEAIRALLATLEANDSKSLDELSKRIDAIKASYQRGLSMLSVLKNRPVKVEEQYKHFNQHLSIVTELLNTLPMNDQGQYGHEVMQEHLAKLDKLMVAKKTVYDNIRQMEHELHHMRSTSMVECEECHHTFKPGISTDTIAEIESCLLVQNENMQEIEHEEYELKRHIIDQEEFLKQIDKIYALLERFLSNAPETLGWMESCGFDIEKGDNHVFVSHLNSCYRDIEIWVELERLESKIDELQTMLDVAQKLSANMDGINGEQLTILDEKIGSLIADCDVTQELIVMARDEIDNYHLYVDMLDQCYMHVENILNDFGRWADAVADEILSEDLKHHQILLSNVEAGLRKAEVTRGLIEDLRRAKEEALDEKESLIILAEELSPTTGLISQLMRGYIASFIEQINLVIEEIWTYEMKVVASGIDGDAIDCKFPVSITKPNANGVGTIESPDISKTSTAQSEIINFGFRVAVIAALGLADYPLYLDEVGVQMDESHRERFGQYLVKLLESKSCSQMYIISHYLAMHGIFSESQVMVLDASNIVNLPASYNQNVEIA